MAKFLVTGGGGFIGSSLVEHLVSQGESVVVLDDFSTGKVENLSGIEDRIKLIEGSITCLDTCREAVQGVDFVLHEAALPSVPRSIENPVDSNHVNVSGTLNMLVASRDEGIKRFVYAASSSAYGDTEVLPKVETMPATPLSPYAITKYTGEMYCHTFFELYGLQTIALRYFNVFGPKQDPTSQYSAVIPKFITAHLRDESPVIYGDGEQSRDFTYIDNVIHANILACAAAPKALGRVFNCACGERVTLNEIAFMIKDILGSYMPVHYSEPRAGDVMHSLADLKSAKDLLRYSPKVSTLEGLEKVIPWYVEQHKQRDNDAHTKVKGGIS